MSELSRVTGIKYGTIARARRENRLPQLLERAMNTDTEPFDLAEARRQDFIARCASLAPGETFTLTWAQFDGSAPKLNLTGCTATLVGPDSVEILKPKH